MKPNTLLAIQTHTSGDVIDDIPDKWETVCLRWCDIKPLTGREYTQAQQVQSTVTHRIRTQYVPDAKSSMRLAKLSGETGEPTRLFNVESVVNVDERNRWSEWMCEEVSVG